MNIIVICVGKLKEKYLKDAVADYAGRLSHYCKIEIIEVSDEKAPENIGVAGEKQVKHIEGQGILKYVKDDAFLIALSPGGIMGSSEKLSSRIAKLAVSGRSNIAFAIGGSLGLSDAVIQRANYRLSFSPMTFPHGLFRVMLLEQIYRAFKIDKNEPYHK